MWLAYPGPPEAPEPSFSFPLFFISFIHHRGTNCKLPVCFPWIRHQSSSSACGCV
jgi:hypothetical protein